MLGLCQNYFCAMEDKVEDKCENKKSETQADSWSVTKKATWTYEKYIANQEATRT